MIPVLCMSYMDPCYRIKNVIVSTLENIFIAGNECISPKENKNEDTKGLRHLHASLSTERSCFSFKSRF